MDAHDEQMTFDDELAAFLAAAGHGDATRPDAGGADPYRVEQTLKESAYEVTELVARGDAAGGGAGEDAGFSAAPARLYVRKRIKLDARMGSAYEKLFGVQQAGARLAHVPRIYECSRTESELVVVMEQVRGESLARRAEREGAGPALSRAAFPRICGAVSELHEQLDPPLIHRDLKPSNIIIADGSDERALGAARAAGEPVIIDFGIARTWREGAESDTVRFGTRGYAAPEQFGFGQTSVRSDVYALGMVLYFCWTGREPRSGLDADDLAGEGVPQGVASVILRATAFDPAARYASASELGRAFLAALPADEGEGGAGGVAANVAPVAAGAAASTGSAPGAIAGRGARVGAGANASAGAGVKGAAATGPSQAPTAKRPVPPAGMPSSTSADPVTSASRSATGPAAGSAPAPSTTGAASSAAGVPAGVASASAELTSGQNRSSSGSRAGLKGLAARVPAWAGRAWNAVVILAWTILALDCIYCIVSPASSAAADSVWYRILEFAFMILAFATAACWLLLDKRRLRERVLEPQGITRRMEHLVCAALVVISLAAWVAISLFRMG